MCLDPTIMGSMLSDSQIIVIDDEIEVECGRTLIHISKYSQFVHIIKFILE